MELDEEIIRQARGPDQPLSDAGRARIHDALRGAAEREASEVTHRDRIDVPTADSATTDPPSSPAGARRVALWLTTAAVLIAGLSLTVVLLVQRDGSAPTTPAATVPTTVSLPSPTLETESEGTVTVDGQEVPFVRWVYEVDGDQLVVVEYSVPFDDYVSAGDIGVAAGVPTGGDNGGLVIDANGSTITADGPFDDDDLLEMIRSLGLLD